MTAKKLNDAEKEIAAQKKADEVAALMGEDSSEPSAAKSPTPPPALKGADKPAPEAEEKAVDETEDQTETVDQTDAEKSNESDDQGADEQDEQKDLPAKAKVGHMVILQKTIHTKDADGKDVKFISSKEPQDLGEYGEMAIKAGYAVAQKGG